MPRTDENQLTEDITRLIETNPISTHEFYRQWNTVFTFDPSKNFLDSSKADQQDLLLILRKLVTIKIITKFQYDVLARYATTPKEPGNTYENNCRIGMLDEESTRSDFFDAIFNMPFIQDHYAIIKPDQRDSARAGLYSFINQLHPLERVVFIWQGQKGGNNENDDINYSFPELPLRGTPILGALIHVTRLNYPISYQSEENAFYIWWPSLQVLNYIIEALLVGAQEAYKIEPIFGLDETIRDEVGAIVEAVVYRKTRPCITVSPKKRMQEPYPNCSYGPHGFSVTVMTNQMHDYYHTLVHATLRKDFLDILYRCALLAMDNYRQAWGVPLKTRGFFFKVIDSDVGDGDVSIEENLPFSNRSYSISVLEFTQRFFNRIIQDFDFMSVNGKRKIGNVENNRFFRPGVSPDSFRPTKSFLLFLIYFVIEMRKFHIDKNSFKAMNDSMISKKYTPGWGAQEKSVVVFMMTYASIIADYLTIHYPSGNITPENISQTCHALINTVSICCANQADLMRQSEALLSSSQETANKISNTSSTNSQPVGNTGRALFFPTPSQAATVSQPSTLSEPVINAIKTVVPTAGITQQERGLLLRFAQDATAHGIRGYENDYQTNPIWAIETLILIHLGLRSYIFRDLSKDVTRAAALFRDVEQYYRQPGNDISALARQIKTHFSELKNDQKEEPKAPDLTSRCQTKP